MKIAKMIKIDENAKVAKIDESAKIIIVIAKNAKRAKIAKMSNTAYLAYIGRFPFEICFFPISTILNANFSDFNNFALTKRWPSLIYYNSPPILIAILALFTQNHLHFVLGISLYAK